MEDLDLLNPDSDKHLFALHFIFWARIQQSLERFVFACIAHPLSSAEEVLTSYGCHSHMQHLNLYRVEKHLTQYLGPSQKSSSVMFKFHQQSWS